MRPEARLAAAAEILDRYLAGEPAEKVLTTWARHSRFAGSKDRAAVRDHVFAAIRRRRSAATLGGAETGRGLIIGLLRATGQDPATFLTGEGHALAKMTEAEVVGGTVPSDPDRIDCPAWLQGELHRSLGDGFAATLAAMQERADLFLRVNTLRGDVEDAIARLAADGVAAQPHALCDTALVVTEGARKVQLGAAYQSGLVEIQDVASQAVAAQVPIPDDGVVLDFCAGGGGKSLALAARGAATVLAHDIDQGRMKDLPSRAERAGCEITRVTRAEIDARAPFDCVVIDVPCSGSGAWRRQPEAKWNLTPERLDALEQTQQAILAEAGSLVRPGGVLAYITCSLLAGENEDQVEGFLARSDGLWALEHQSRLSPMAGGDGFFLAILRRNA